MFVETINNNLKQNIMNTQTFNYKGTELEILRQRVETRGGGIEIDLSNLGFYNEKMTAFQNYLGGGVLGRIDNDCTYRNFRNDKLLKDVAKHLSMYFHSLTNPHKDEWGNRDFYDNQNLPVRAY
tara:strand:- start:362 stop:733 length:372 start_codon:yes stop_codon:yes gene_type:complete